MRTKANIFRGPALWTLIAGVAIGAGSMYSVFTGGGGSFALAQTKATLRPAAITRTIEIAEIKRNLAGCGAEPSVFIHEHAAGCKCNCNALLRKP